MRARRARVRSPTCTGNRQHSLDPVLQTPSFQELINPDLATGHCCDIVYGPLASTLCVVLDDQQIVNLVSTSRSDLPTGEKQRVTPGTLVAPI